MKKPRPIEIFISPIDSKLFTDWWDFADFVKQQNLQGIPVTVYSWRYTDGEITSKRP